MRQGIKLKQLLAGKTQKERLQFFVKYLRLYWEKQQKEKRGK